MGRIRYVRWLDEDDAPAIAHLEKRTYSRNQRDGRTEIADDLFDAVEDNRSLSVGLFDGSRLVAYILAYLREDRAAIFDDFEVSYARTEELSGRSIYVEDIIVLPGFERHASLLYSKWRREINRLDPTLPMDAFCFDALRQRWTRHSRLFRSLGFQLADAIPVKDESRDDEWFWMSWEPIVETHNTHHGQAMPGRRLSSAALPKDMHARLVHAPGDWTALREEWGRLLDAMPNASGFMAYDYLRSWWNLFGMPTQLQIVTLYQDDNLVGVAPLMIAPKRILGVYRPRLEFIGDQVNTDSPHIIIDPLVENCATLLWRAVVSLNGNWDAIYLREQLEVTVSQSLTEVIDGSRYSLTGSEPIDAPFVRFGQSWDDYLASRSRALRKNFRRKKRQLQKLGNIDYVSTSQSKDADTSLTAYLNVESRSWKAKAKMGLSGNPFRVVFYRQLTADAEFAAKLRFRFLRFDGKAIAATIGLLQGKRFESLEICHDTAYDVYSPGVVLTGMELEECHGAHDYSEYNFLVGTYANKKPWQTDARQVHDLYVLPRTWWGHANRLLIFWLKPRIKAALKRFQLMERAEKLLDKIERRFR